MLSIKELEDVSRQLDAFDEQHNDHQHQLNAILRKYRYLLKKFQQLKTEHDHGRQGARNTNNNNGDIGSAGRPYVLLVVDGDGYDFRPDLLAEEEEGGRRAAHLLRQQLQQALSSRAIHGCDIRVRIYADFVGLSKRLSLSKVLKPHKRSIAPFAAGFTSSNPLFDFVDAGETADGTYSKLAATFQIYADDLHSGGRCRHIFFAGCYDGRHVSMLKPWRSSREQISLIVNKRPPVEYDDLNLLQERFDSVFTETSGGVALPKAGPSHSQTHVRSASTKQDQWQVPDFTPGATDHGVADDGLSTPSKAPPRQYRLDDSGLPVVPHEKQGLVPVNRKGERIDVQVPVPPESVMRKYAHMDPRPCNSYHVGGKCGKPDCPFGHAPIDQPIYDAIRVKVRESPCKSGHGCRVRNCMYGHVCSKEGCTGPRPGKCKLRPTMHQMDTEVFDWIEPYGPKKSGQHALNGDEKDTDTQSSIYDSLHGRASSSSDWRSSHKLSGVTPSAGSSGVPLSYQQNSDHQMMADPHTSQQADQHEGWGPIEGSPGFDVGGSSWDFQTPTAPAW